jgi:hypothetical protein
MNIQMLSFAYPNSRLKYRWSGSAAIPTLKANVDPNVCAHAANRVRHTLTAPAASGGCTVPALGINTESCVGTGNVGPWNSVINWLSVLYVDADCTAIAAFVTHRCTRPSSSHPDKFAVILVNLAVAVGA